jgi:alcohol dehydrogenase class IV
MGIPSFRRLGLKQHQLAEIARKSFENNSSPSNPRDATTDDYLSILTKAFLE